jgi:hypothetical protein
MSQFSTDVIRQIAAVERLEAVLTPRRILPALQAEKTGLESPQQAAQS